MSELSTEQLLQIIGENTPGRINLNLGDLDMYLGVARAAIKAAHRAPVSTPQQSAQRASVDTPAVQQQAEPDPNRDPLYDKTVAVVRAHQRASLSLVQRTLLIGYNRTARLFEAMEKAGVISPFDENGHRTVLPAAPSPAPQGEQA